MLVVGAGPTGLVLALWLTRLGVRVRVIDKAAEAGTTSRAIAVQARTLELYRQIGLADAVVTAAARVDAANLWVNGKRAARLVIGKMGAGVSPYPYFLSYAQDEHERLLVDRLAALGVKVERRTELKGLAQQPDGVRATLRDPEGREQICDVAYLAGCDGGHSSVRSAMGVSFPGSTYQGVFYVADVDARGPAVDGEIHVDIEDADFIAVFPLKAGGHVRLIGPLAADGTPAGREMTFDDIAKSAVSHLDLEMGRPNWFSTYHVHHRVASRFRDRRVFLLGDAAHIHSPVGGQGMNTGIGDAVNLAWKLAAVIRDGWNDRVLATYEPERIAFARRLVATTDRAFTFVTKRGRLARVVRTRVAPTVLSAAFRLPAMRRLMFRTVSQTVINYRDSALSSGEAGDIKGGDRLPWVTFADGSDNWKTLESVAWQAHVYGEATAIVREACDAAHVPLHVFPWNREAEEKGLSRGAAYVVRPDGYVGMANRVTERGAVAKYFETWGVK